MKSQSQKHAILVLDIKNIQWLWFALLVGEEVSCPLQMSLWNLRFIGKPKNAVLRYNAKTLLNNKALKYMEIQAAVTKTDRD